jgi:hypothetical protein
MTITEPSTLVTDLLLSAASLWFALALAREARRARQRSIALWAAATLAGGSAALLGGIYHGFGPALGAVAAAILWKGTVWLAGISSLTSLLGSLTAVLAGRLRRPLIGAVWLKFAVYAVWMAGHDDFRYVVYDQLTAMTAILILHACDIRRRKDSAGRFIVAAALVSFGAAIVQRAGFDPHRLFNHNDLFHVVQIGANYLFYRGALLLRDRDRVSAATGSNSSGRG